MQNTAFAIIVVTLLLAFYTYVGYPLLLALIGAARIPQRYAAPSTWPRISITIPAYNEEKEIGAALEALLAADYPADRREILVVSDASTDRTDEIVRNYFQRGVRLVRMAQRTGKTAAENAVSHYLSGEIVINTDASIRIDRHALKPLIAAFADPTVGVASGRDVSVARGGTAGNPGESRYVGYEMLVRALETRAGGIIGASGCLYAIRADLHRIRLEEGLSRDFAAPLNARVHGYNAVSVDAALCYVPRTLSLQKEYRRKVRTMTRGMQTLWAMRSILNPLRFGTFAWKLWSHKICRWLLPWAAAASLFATLALALTSALAAFAATSAIVIVALGFAAFLLSERRAMPYLLTVAAYTVMGNVAAIQAALRALHGRQNAIWEPTRRGAAIG